MEISIKLKIKIGEMISSNFVYIFKKCIRTQKATMRHREHPLWWPTVKDYGPLPAMILSRICRISGNCNT